MDKKFAATEQSKPDGKGRKIIDLVLEDLKQREQKGIETYGESLRSHNGRDPLIDAYQEALDLAVYLRQVLEERETETV